MLRNVVAAVLLLAGTAAHAQTAPSFAGGTPQTLVVCQNSGATSINSLLAVNDPDVGQVETWSVSSPASNGTVVATYSVTSTGGTLTPTGLTYTPTTGFSGTDAFTVMVMDDLGGMATTTINVTVNATPAAITGTATVCEGSTTTLSSATPGGAWSSSNTVIGTVSAGGAVMGMNDGIVTISYTLPTTCYTTTDVTVNATPSAIVGTRVVCEGSSVTVFNLDGGGTWSTSNVSIATVNMFGVVTGVDAGVVNVSYAFASTGCAAVATFTVNATPGAITGTTAVCENSTTTLANPDAGGAWSSSNTAVGTISAGGIVSGISAGTTTITYAFPTTCRAITEVTVNPLPAIIGGASNVCVAAITALSNSTSGGTWASSNTAAATIGSTDGIVSGIMAGNTTITYTLATGCMRTHDMTVNPLPVVYNVTGGGSYCFSGSGVHIGVSNSESGYAYDLYNGSTYITSQTGTGGTVDFGSITGAGTYSVVATSPASCNSDMSGTATVTIISLVIPSVTVASTPDDTVCAGTAATFTATHANGGPTPGYVWSVNGTPVASTSSTYTYLPVNGDVISVVLTSSEPCPSPSTASTSMPMVVVSNETPTVNIMVGPNDTLCQFTTAVFSVGTASFTGTTPVYTWYRNAVSTGLTGPVYSYVPVDGDVLSVRLNSNYRCPITNNVPSNNIIMQIDSVYVPIATFDVYPGVNIKAGTTVTVAATVKQGGIQPMFQWFKNGAPISGATNSSYTSSTLVNNDSISCTIWATGGCSYYTFNAVKMKVTTGFEMESGNDANIVLVPNPNTGDFIVKGTLATTDNAEVSLEVTNMLGQTVYANRVIAQSGNLEERVQIGTSLANGMYMLNVRSGTESKVFRFVVQR